MMVEKTQGSPYLKLFGCGCGSVLLLMVLAGITGWRWIDGFMDSARVAEEILDELDARHGGIDDWSPNPEASLGAEGIDDYLEVRHELLEPCSEIAGFANAIMELENLDRGGREPSAKEALSIMGPALKLPQAITGYIERRNLMLQQVDMGLGEYAFIHVLAIHSGPTAPVVDHDRPFDQDLDGEARRAFKRILAELAESSSDEDPSWAELVAAELERLDSDDEALPFPEGLPEPWLGLIEARRDEIEATRCPDSENFALAISEQKGMSIQIH